MTGTASKLGDLLLDFIQEHERVYSTRSPVLEMGGAPSAIFTYTGGSDDVPSDIADNNADVCWVLDYTFPATFNTDGLIFEIGGTGRGSGVGYVSSGATLRFAAGDGLTTATSTDTVVLDIPTSELPAGETGVLTWEYRINPGRIRAWWNDRLIGEESTTGGGALDSSSWAGGNNGNLGTSSSAVCAAMTNGADPGTIIDKLMVFENVLVDDDLVKRHQSSGVWKLRDLMDGIRRSKPVEYVGSAFASTNGTTDFTLTLPTHHPDDMIVMQIIYENSTTNRPTITNFTQLNSRNGVADEAAHTGVVLSGKQASNTVTIPNDATYGGGVVSAILLRNVAEIGYPWMSSGDSTAYPMTDSPGPDDAYVLLQGVDAASETMTAYTWDAKFQQTAEHVDPVSVAGRAGAVAFGTRMPMFYPQIEIYDCAGRVGGNLHAQFVARSRPRAKYTDLIRGSNCLAMYDWSDPDCITTVNGNVTDVSGNGRTLTNVGANFGWTREMVYGFTDSDYYTASNTGLSFGTGDWTINALFHYRSIQTYNTLVEIGSWTDSLLIRLDSPSTFGIYTEGSTFTISWTPVIDTLYYLEVMRISGTCYLYVNGQLIGSVANSTNISLANTQMWVGRSQHNTGQYCDMMLRFLSIYDRSLSAEERAYNNRVLRHMHPFAQKAS